MSGKQKHVVRNLFKASCVYSFLPLVAALSNNTFFSFQWIKHLKFFQSLIAFSCISLPSTGPLESVELHILHLFKALEQLKHSPEDDLLEDCCPVLTERGACGSTKPSAPPVRTGQIQSPHDPTAAASGNLPAPQFRTILCRLSQGSVLATPVWW